jgi:hypothetical protein
MTSTSPVSANHVPTKIVPADLTWLPLKDMNRTMERGMTRTAYAEELVSHAYEWTNATAGN